MEADQLIATENLKFEDVPSPDADVQVLEEFCLTIDGYQGERYSIDDLLREAERVEHLGFENATLDELRTAAFIRQRELRWTTFEQPNPMLVWKIRNLVRAIRSRVGEKL